MEEKQIDWNNEYDLNAIRLFEHPDNLLYHPVKEQFIEREQKLKAENTSLQAKLLKLQTENKTLAGHLAKMKKEIASLLRWAIVRFYHLYYLSEIFNSSS